MGEISKKPVKYAVVDAFTDSGLKGNPAAICLLEEERDDQWMQSLATEFNLSKTCYLTRMPAFDSPHPRFHLRWFTPAREIEFCGHATLAAAHTCFTYGLVKGNTVEFSTRSGILTAHKVLAYGEPGSVKSENGVVEEPFFIELDFPAVSTTDYNSNETSFISKVLGGAPVVEIKKTASDDLFVVLPSAKHVIDANPEFEEVQALQCHSRVFISGIAPPESGYDFFSRFFCPKYGVNELQFAAASISPDSCIGKDSWLRIFMEKYSLEEDGSNFEYWESNFRLAVEADRKEQYIFLPPLPTPNAQSTQVAVDAYKEHQHESNSIKNVLIFSMVPALQRRFIRFSAYEIFVKLTNMFSPKPRISRYDTTVRFFEARLERGQPVGPHVLKMIEYVETLKRLDNPISEEFAVDRILHSLHDGFIHFRVTYNMNNMRKSLYELHALLVQAEKDMAASGSEKKNVLTVYQKSKMVFKKKYEKGKNDIGQGVMSTKHKPKRGATPDQRCFYCSGTGHWKRNCPKYLQDKKDNKIVALT